MMVTTITTNDDGEDDGGDADDDDDDDDEGDDYDERLTHGHDADDGDDDDSDQTTNTQGEGIERIEWTLPGQAGTGTQAGAPWAYAETQC